MMPRTTETSNTFLLSRWKVSAPVFRKKGMGSLPVPITTSQKTWSQSTGTSWVTSPEPGLVLGHRVTVTKQMTSLLSQKLIFYGGRGNEPARVTKKIRMQHLNVNTRSKGSERPVQRDHS